MSRPASVQGDLYNSRLAKNLRALIQHQSDGSVNAWCARHKLPQSTYNKIANGLRGATVAVLEEFEERTGYGAWQLLHPEFDPKKMPPLADARTLRVAAIFAAIREPLLRDKAESIMEQFADDQPALAASGTIHAPMSHQ